MYPWIDAQVNLISGFGITGASRYCLLRAYVRVPEGMVKVDILYLPEENIPERNEIGICASLPIIIQ